MVKRKSTQADSDLATAFPPAGLSFEEASARLSQIVSTLESQQSSLQDAINAYQEGTHLVLHCQQLLSDVEQKIEILNSQIANEVEGNKDA